MDRFETVYSGGRKGRKYVIQKEQTPEGEVLCWRVGYRGAGYYFTTKAEAYAYCQGRGFFGNSGVNPFRIGNESWVEWWNKNHNPQGDSDSDAEWRRHKLIWDKENANRWS